MRIPKSKKSNKKNTYNPNLQLGYSMMQSMQLNNAENLSNRVYSYTNGALRGTTQYDAQFNENPENDLSDTYYADQSTTSSASKKKSNEPVRKKPGFFSTVFGTIGGALSSAASTAGEILFGDTDSVGEIWDAVKTNTKALFDGDVWRMLLQKRAQADFTAAADDLKNWNIKLEDLDYILNQYLPLLKRYQDSLNELSRLESQNAPLAIIQRAQNNFQKLSNALRLQNEFIKTDGKKSAIFRDLFFSGRNLTPENIAHMMTLDTGISDINWHTSGQNVVSEGLRGWGTLLGNTVDALVNLPSKNNFYKALSKADVNDRSFDNLFENYARTGGYNELSNKLKEAQKLIADSKTEALQKVMRRARRLANGNEWFDPKKIDPHFKELADKNYGIVGGLTYGLSGSLAQLGSSFSDIEDFGASMALDLAMRKVVLPGVIAVATRNPEAAAAAETAGTVVDAARTVSFANKFRNAKNIVNEALAGLRTLTAAIEGNKYIANPITVANVAKATTAAEVGASTWITERMRENETHSEVMDAYALKVMQQSMKSKANMPKVMNSIDQFINTLGLDPNQYDDLEKMLIALGYNVQTGDPSFEAIKKNARNGLNKIWNDNMSLAIMDYWEKLPMLPYMGSVLRDAGRNITNPIFNRVGRKAGALITDRFTQEAVDRSINAVLNNRISRVADKFSKNLASKAMYDTGIKYLKRRFKEGAALGAKEGIEEGLQQLLLSRYQRGEYANDNEALSVFSLTGVVHDADLGASALAAYFGLNYGDPDNGDDELRHNMTIGAISAQFFRGFGAASNLVKSKDYNLRNVIALMKSDKALKGMAADNYGRSQDQDHVGVFFDAMNKRGVTRDRLMASLLTMQKYNRQLPNTLVTDEYIDNDIQLLNDTYSLMLLDLTNYNLKSLGIKDKSNRHKAYIQNGVRTINDFKDLLLKSIELGQTSQLAINDIIDKAINGNLGDENPSVNKVVEAILKRYTTRKSNHDTVYNKLRSDFLKKHKDFVNKFNTADPNDIEAYETREEAAWQAYKADLLKSLEAKSKDAKQRGANEEASRYNDFANWYKDIESQEDYLRMQLNNMFALHTLGLKKSVLNHLRGLLARNKAIRKETGTDINTDNLQSIINFIQDDISRIESEMPQAAQKELQDRFGKFENLESYDTNQKSYIINSAMANILAVRAKAYDRTIFLNPVNSDIEIKNSYSQIRWNDLTKEDRAAYIKELKDQAQAEGKKEPTLKEIKAKYRNDNIQKYKKIRDSIAHYRKLLRKLKGIKEADRTPELVQQIQDAINNLGLAIVLQDLGDAENRKYIANKNFDEDRPLSGQDIDDAQSGDLKAQNKVKEEALKQDDKDAVEQASGQTVDESRDDKSATQDNNEHSEAVEGNDGESKTLDLDNESLNVDDETVSEVEDIVGDSSLSDQHVQSVDDILNGVSEEEKARQKKLQGKKKSSDIASEILDTSDNRNEKQNEEKQEHVKKQPVEKETPLTKGESDISNDSTDSELLNTQNDLPNIVFDVFGDDYGYGDIIWKDGLDGNVVRQVKVLKSTDENGIRHIRLLYLDATDTTKSSDKYPFGAGCFVNYDFPENADLDNVTEVIFDPTDVRRISIKIGDSTIEGTIKPVSKEEDDLGSDMPTSATVYDNLSSETVNDESNNSQESQGDDNSINNDTPMDSTSSLEDGHSQMPHDSSLDISKIDIKKNDNGTFTVIYDGDELSSDIADMISSEQSSLTMADSGMSDSATEDDYQNTESEKNVTGKQLVYKDYVGTTFFYDPNDSSQFHERSVNGKALKFKYKIGNGKELSKNLSKKGWVQSCDTYYVVSGNPENYANDRDNLTVNLVIDDKKAKRTYIVSMRTPGKYAYKNERGEWVYKDRGLEELQGKLRMHGVDPDLIGDALIEEIRRTYEFTVKDYTSDRTSDAYEAKLRDWYYKLANSGEKLRNLYDYINYRARLRARKVGVAEDLILTEKLINQQIAKLRENRNTIINAYCTFNNGKIQIPTEIRTDVRPDSLTTSNGRFAEERDEFGYPIFRNLDGDENGFGLSSDIEELSQQLTPKSGKLEENTEFGYGSGAFGNSPFTIYPLNNPNRQEYYSGKGLAGKIYYILSSKLMPGSNRKRRRIPIQLHEFTFKQQADANGNSKRINSLNDVHLALDPNTGLIVNEKYKPSAAEAILYLLCGKIDAAGLQMTADLLQAFCDFIVNNGEKTMLYISGSNRTKEQILSAKLPYYQAKQLGWIERENGSRFFIIGNNRFNGDPSRYSFLYTDLFPKDNASVLEKQSAEENRRKVVYLISQNMHWNTDVDTMQNPLVFNQVTDALLSYFRLNKNAKEVKLFGLDEFTFKKDDLFKEDLNGNLIKKNVTGLAWLIHTGKLQTSASKELFKDPFVFASGVRIDDSQQLKKEVEEKQIDTTKDKPASIIEAAATDTALYVVSNDKSLLKLIQDTAYAHLKKLLQKARAHKGLDTIKDLSEEFRKKRLSESTITSPDGGKLQDLILLDITDRTLKDFDSVKAALKQKALEYNKFAKARGLKEINPDKIRVSDMLNTPQGLAMYHNTNTNNFWVMCMLVFDDGNAYIYGRKPKEVDANIKRVTGAFSTLIQKGRLDVEKSRLWLNRVLGISDENVIVTSAIMRSFSDEAVFGVTDICTDLLTGRKFPMILLSRMGGRGLAYHEAWHYVNLLINNKAARAKIYSEYVKQHSEARSLKYRQIEELLAEDFREYIEMREGTNLSSRVRRLFNNILDFLNQSRKKTTLRMMFEAVRNGEFAGKKLDPESMQEFQEAYSAGVNSAFKIPGISGETIDSFKGITSYKLFYEVSTSIGFDVIDQYGLTDVGAIRLATSELFENYLKDRVQTADNDSAKAIYQDVLNNKAVFGRIIDNLFAELGINSKLLKLDKLEEEAEGKDTGDSPVDGHQENNFEVSKKDNVAFRAKLFLMQNPKARFVRDSVSGEKVLLYEYDDTLGTRKYVTFNESWNKILNDLWLCDTYNAKDENGDYTPTSIFGTVLRLSKTDPFYAVLYERLLDTEGDVLLLNQIFGTICSQKPQVAFFRLSDPVYHMTELDSDAMEQMSDDFGSDYTQLGSKLVGDRYRNWTLYSDNTLLAKRNIPRNWSKIIPQTTLVEDGRVSRQTSIEINNLFNRAQLILKSSEGVEEKNEQLRNILLQVLSIYSIPIDDLVVDRFLQLMANEDQDATLPSVLYSIYSQIFKKSETGSLKYFADVIRKSVNAEFFRVGKKQISLDRLFTGYKLDSLISKLAEAYNDMHPSSAEFSISGPGRKTIYPISLNNELSDKVNLMNIPSSLDMLDRERSPYVQHSLFTNIIRDERAVVAPGNRIPANRQFRLCTFVGMDDERTNSGLDYFGISPMEDYLAKLMMTSNDMIILPTMSDKKTWYAIKNPNLHLVHDAMTWRQDASNLNIRYLHFSDNTINIFLGYFIDELESLRLYYSKGNIKWLIEHPNNLRKNFHGKIKNGRMQWGGNGGMFRYMYDILHISDESGNNTMNLNQYLEFLYNAQKLIEDNPVDYGGVSQLRENDKDELDGFEMIRKYLRDLQDGLLNDDETIGKIKEGINSMLIRNTMLELENLSQTSGIYLPLKLFTRVNLPNSGDLAYYQCDGIPILILKQYKKIFDSFGFDGENAYGYSANLDTADYALSAIASHVANNAISVIEIEKMFTGDPAWYKWSLIKGSFSTTEITHKEGDNIFTTKVQNISEKHVDKTKRLGSVLSPGENIRNIYGEDILELYPELNQKEYTFANLGDIIAKSRFTKEVIEQFKRQEFINWVTLHKQEYFGKNISEDDIRKTINKWYANYKQFEKDYNAFSNKEVKLQIESDSKKAAAPYLNITVSDALVCIRPAMYRYLRIAMGEWSFNPDETGYSDEEAYNIIEGIGEYANRKGEWMTNPELQAKVTRFLLKPLKMTYFLNKSIAVSQNADLSFNYTNLPIYNKMAIFPMFGFACTSETGKMLYDRMNKPGQELDMVGFESAVKVGDNLRKYTPFPEDKDGNVPVELNHLANVTDGVSFLDAESDHVDNKESGLVDASYGESYLDRLNQIAVQRLYINNLRLQLNTDAHEADSRPIGTQAFKLAFSNIDDDSLYGININDYSGLPLPQYTGRQLKDTIMTVIKAMTIAGEIRLNNQYFNRDGSVNDAAVNRLINRIIKNNNLGATVEDLIANGGKIASQLSRLLFEQSVIKLVNKEVIDKNTQGGSAVQQSIFGFTGHRNVIDYSDDNAFHQLNNGNEPKWLSHNNSMEVFLSMNFFRAVLPQGMFETGTYQQLREWLIEHDFIYGTKKDGTKSNPRPFGIGYRIPTQGQSSIFSFITADVLPKQSGDTIIVPREFTSQTGSDYDVDKLFLATLSFDKDGNLIKPEAVIVEYNKLLKDGVTVKPVRRTVRNLEAVEKLKEDETISNINIIDYQSTDNYANKLSILSRSSQKALSNELILLYMRVLCDPRNFKLNRGSIDTITDMIKLDLLPHLKGKLTQYVTGGYELLPSFASREKMELYTGKQGIAPFALNVTNAALTLWAHLTMDYKENYFGFGDLDNPLSRDGTYVADWLSAMVNAHVDVAKDPYVFDINVNKATYNMASFLIRAGMSIGTFTFLANPAIKEYATRLNSSGSMYGSNIRGTEVQERITPTVLLSNRKQNSKNSILLKYLNLTQNLYNNILGRNNNGGLTNEQIHKINTWLSIIRGEIKPNTAESEMREMCKLIFNKDVGINAIEHPDSLLGKLFSTMCLWAFGQIKPYADELLNLVSVSRVDTKKFGNTISLQLNYLNNYKRFKYGDHQVGWKLSKDMHLPKDMSPLDYYFERTYIDDELSKATSIAQKLLTKHLYSATPEFQTILHDTMCRLYGAKEIEVRGITEYVYNKGANDEKVTLLSTALDNVTRFKVFSLYGNKFDGELDYTRSALDIKYTLYRLLYGDQNAPENKYEHYSIFELMQMLITAVKRDPEVAEAQGLHDYSDLYGNELLDYLTPVMPTRSNKYPFGRFTLRLNAISTDVDQKQVLQSAFYLLLTYTGDPDRNNFVSRVAKDLALYAYYSTYDLNGANSFFDLVPAEFRTQYDQSLAYGLNNPTKTFNEILSGGTTDLFGIVARNYWYDDNIVPEYIGSTKGAKTLIANNDILLNRVRIGKQLVYGTMILPSYKTNSEYIKMIKGDQVYLYHKVGTASVKIIRNGKKQNISKNVYMVVPKAGLHIGANHQYEFYINSEVGSLFSANNLPDVFSLEDYDVDGSTYQGAISLFESWLALPKNIVDRTNKYQKDVTVDKPIFTRNPNAEVKGYYYDYGSSTSTNVATTLLTSDGKIELLGVTKEPYQKSKENADCIISLDKSPQDIADSITKLVGNDNSTSPISIMFNYKAIDLSNEELQQKVQDVIRNITTINGSSVSTVYVADDDKGVVIANALRNMTDSMLSGIITLLYNRNNTNENDVLDKVEGQSYNESSEQVESEDTADLQADTVADNVDETIKEESADIDSESAQSLDNVVLSKEDQSLTDDTVFSLDDLSQLLDESSKPSENNLAGENTESDSNQSHEGC